MPPSPNTPRAKVRQVDPVLIGDDPCVGLPILPGGSNDNLDVSAKSIQESKQAVEREAIELTSHES